MASKAEMKEVSENASLSSRFFGLFFFFFFFFLFQFFGWRMIGLFDVCRCVVVWQWEEEAGQLCGGRLEKISTGRRYFDLIVTFCIFLCVWSVGLRDPVVVVEAVWFGLQSHYMAVRHVLVGCS